MKHEQEGSNLQIVQHAYDLSLPDPSQLLLPLLGNLLLYQVLVAKLLDHAKHSEVYSMRQQKP
jgi:hypothetical protein